MNRLLISTLIALGIHGLLLGVNLRWLKIAPPVKPNPQAVMITLAHHQIPELKTRPAPRKPVAPLVKPDSVIKEVKNREPEPAINKDQGKTPKINHIPEQSKKQVKPEPLKKQVKLKRSLKALTKADKPQPSKLIPEYKPVGKLQQVSKAEQRLLNSPEREQKLRNSSKDQQPTLVEKPEDRGGESSEQIDPRERSEMTAAIDSNSATAALTEARPLYRLNPPPTYPRTARRRGYEGIVVLEVQVDRDGKVGELKVFKSSGCPLLDKAALTAVKNWLFEPGRRGDDKVEMWVRVPIRFQLN